MNMALCELSSYRKPSLLLLFVMPLHNVINFPSGFDLLQVIQNPFLLGGKVQEYI